MKILRESERKLVQIGCDLHSKLLMERDRDEKGGLTRWLTGRRFVYVKIPDRPLPEKINIGPATATLYHREQKLSPNNAVCSRCLTTGHRASACANEVVCRTCKKSGHKSGHPSCSLTHEDSDKNQHSGPSTSAPVSDTAATDSPVTARPSTTTTTSSTLSPVGPSPAAGSQRRGRDTRTQSRLSFQSRSLSRSREKRPHSSQPQHRDAIKTARIDIPLSVSGTDSAGETAQAGERTSEGS